METPQSALANSSNSVAVLQKRVELHAGKSISEEFSKSTGAMTTFRMRVHEEKSIKHCQRDEGALARPAEQPELGAAL